MLSALEQRAAELGFGTLTLETTVQQAPAIQLYTRRGYREVGRSRKAGFDVLEFEKKIEWAPPEKWMGDRAKHTG